MSHTDIVILGDTNFPVNVNNSGFSLMNSLLQNFSITLRDDLITGTQRFIYVNEVLKTLPVSTIVICLEAYAPLSIMFLL